MTILVYAILGADPCSLYQNETDVTDQKPGNLLSDGTSGWRFVRNICYKLRNYYVLNQNIIETKVEDTQGTAYRITNNTGIDYFVPTKTEKEWQSFVCAAAHGGSAYGGSGLDCRTLNLNFPLEIGRDSSVEEVLDVTIEKKLPDVCDGSQVSYDRWASLKDSNEISKRSRNCYAPANGSATCTDAVCGFSCNSGYTKNGNSCVRSGCASNSECGSGQSCDGAQPATAGNCRGSYTRSSTSAGRCQNTSSTRIHRTCSRYEEDGGGNCSRNSDSSTCNRGSYCHLSTHYQCEWVNGTTTTTTYSCSAKRYSSCRGISGCTWTGRSAVRGTCNYRYRWSASSGWSTCTRSCGGGTQTRSYHCLRSDGSGVQMKILTGLSGSTFLKKQTLTR